MKKICKFTSGVTNSYMYLEMPEGAQVLSVGSQTRNICLWAICDPDAPKETRCFAIVGTEWELPGGLGEFIGTVPMAPLERHVFEVGSKRTGS